MWPSGGVKPQSGAFEAFILTILVMFSSQSWPLCDHGCQQHAGALGLAEKLGQRDHCPHLGSCPHVPPQAGLGAGTREEDEVIKHSPGSLHYRGAGGEQQQERADCVESSAAWQCGCGSRAY